MHLSAREVTFVHETPLVRSDERMHELDDEASCWCGPVMIQASDREDVVRIVHRP